MVVTQAPPNPTLRALECHPCQPSHLATYCVHLCIDCRTCPPPPLAAGLASHVPLVFKRDLKQWFKRGTTDHDAVFPSLDSKYIMMWIVDQSVCNWHSCLQQASAHLGCCIFKFWIQDRMVVDGLGWWFSVLPCCLSVCLCLNRFHPC